MTSQLPRFWCPFLSCQQQKPTKNGVAVKSSSSFLFCDNFSYHPRERGTQGPHYKDIKIQITSAQKFWLQCVSIGNLPINVGVDLFDSICKESKVAKKEKLKLEKAKPGLGWVGSAMIYSPSRE